MDRSLTPERLWPDGWTKLHVYLLPELDVDIELARLIGGCEQVIAGFDFISPVCRPWLHATVQMITGVSGSAVGVQTRDRLLSCLAEALADVPPFTLTAGSPMATSTGVMLNLDGDLEGEPFRLVYQRVREAVRDVMGADATDYDTMPPHISVGYGTAAGDSGLVQNRLRRLVRPSTAPMTVRAVHLLAVRQLVDTSEYQWDAVGSIPLAG